MAPDMAAVPPLTKTWLPDPASEVTALDEVKYVAVSTLSVPSEPLVFTKPLPVRLVSLATES